ncbi:MAG: hypothetical protein ABJB97_01305 [Acidobacteriota bacterium]
MNKQNSNHVGEQVSERNDATVEQPVEKKAFVEPVVSVPVDVLEATTFFQAPTIEASTV